MLYQIRKLKQSIKVRGLVLIRYFEFSKTFTYPGESHDFWEMVYVDKGEAIVTSEDRNFILKPGEVYFHKPNEFHKITSASGKAPNVCIISFLCTSKDMRHFRDLKAEVPEKARKLIASMIEEARHCNFIHTFDVFQRNDKKLGMQERSENSFGAEQMIQLYLEQFLILMLRRNESLQKQRVSVVDEEVGDQLVKAMITYLEERIYNRLSVTELCKSFNYSKTYLSRLFKNTTGHTISEYYTALKITEAKRIIREEELNFAQVANRLDFDNPQYFSRTFKRISGMTPKEYKTSIIRGAYDRSDSK